MSSPLERGDARHPQEEERKFKCSECGRGYRHAGSLTNHRRTHEVGSFQCSICGKENWNASQMKNHLRSHASSRTYSCSDRGKRFRPEAQLLTHERVHVSQTSEGESCRSNALGNYPRGDERGQKPDSNEGLNGVWVPAGSVPEDVCNSPPAVDRPFRCSLCEKSYIHLRSLINHKKTHQLGVFECTVCFKVCSNMGALYSHQRTHKASIEKEPDPLQNPHAPGNFCHLCEALFPSSAEFQDHIRLHNSSSQSLPEQVNVSTGSGFTGLPHSVPQGDAATPPSSDGAPKAEESDERPFKCHTCGKSYRHSGSLINHKRSHQVGVFHCSVCSKKYPHLAALRSHLRLHRARRPSFLLHAEAEPLTLGGQQQGGFYPRGEPEDEENMADGGSGGAFSDQDATPGLQPRHVCADCGETFADMPGIKSHSLSCPALRRQLAVVDQDDSLTSRGTSDGNLSRNHLVDVSAAPPNGGGEDEVPDEDDGDHYQCSVCGNRYTTMMALRSHLRGHSQSHDAPQRSGPPSLASLEGERGGEPGEMMICSTCGETFVNRQEDLITHHLLHKQSEADRLEGLPANSEVAGSKEETSIICSRCGISCSSIHHLRSHGCAADEKDVKVEVRPQREDVGPDAETAGGEQRKYRCDQCGRSYRHAGSLLNHKKSHKTGVFRCAICQKRFYNLLALKNHQRSHFDVKRHTCGECGKAFKVQKQLLNHLRRHDENQAKVLNGQIQVLPLSNGSRPSPACGAGQQAQDEKRPFSCEQCGRSYRHAGSLVNHRNSHKTGEYYCSVCRNVYSNQLAMKNHLRSHFAYKKHLCQNCGKGFRRKKQLLAHVCAELGKGGAAGRTGLRSRTFRCKDCKRDFLSADTLAAHGCAGTPGEEERPFVCDICHRSYRHAGSLLNHKNTHKTGHFSCAFCSKPFSNPMALRNHTRIHTQKKKHACPTCGKAFRLASVLQSHQRVHSRAPARFSCSSCGESFRGRPGLRRHRCRRGQGVNAPSGVQPSDGGDKCFMCDLCGRSYRHAGSLLNHKKSHSEDLHQCTFCLQTFPDPVSLQLHSQERRHCCPECGKTFCLVAHLQSHMEAHSRNPGDVHHAAQGEDEPAEDRRCWDSGANQSAGPVPTGEGSVPEEKSHVCDHCGRAYRHAGSLLNHKNSHKTGRFFCSVCQKEFTNLMALRNHRRIHTEPKRYQCLTCGKAFRVSTQLICHRRIHTKEKPFGCQLCSKSFSSKSNLRHHQKIHQNQNPSQTYDSPFNMKADAFMHLDFESFL